MNGVPLLRDGEPGEVGISEDRLRRLRESADLWVKSGLTQSLAYLVARRGVIVAEHAFGRLSYEHQSAPLRSDAVFSLASASKPITATAIMQLVDGGHLSLNRPVVEYVPEVCGKDAQHILVHHLLTHTSGYSASAANARLLGVFGTLPAAQPDPNQSPTIQRLLEALYPLDPVGVAGQESRYCGVNYLFLGEIVRRVSGVGLAEYALTHIFGPLEMKSSSIGLLQTLAPRRVIPNPEIYTDFPGYNPNDPVRLSMPHGASGAFSTVKDMGVFMQMFLNRGSYGNSELLSPAAVSQMTQNQIPGIGARDGSGRWIAEASWGLGFAVQGASRWRRAHGTLQPIGTFYHQGASGAAVFADPASQTLGVFLSVIRRIDSDTEEFYWEFDRFQNMVMAALRDQ